MISLRNAYVSPLWALSFLLSLATLAACSGDPAGTSCEPNTLCACGSDNDCPEGEACDPFAAVCLPQGAGGADTTIDAGADTTAPDASVDAPEDTTLTPDTAEDGSSEDVSTDVIVDADTADGSGDAADAADGSGDADADQDADAETDTSDGGAEDVDVDTEEPDVGPPPTPDPINNPWVAFVSDRPTENDPSGLALSKLFVVRFDRFNLTEIVTPLVAQVDTPSWRPDGRQLASTLLGATGRQLWLYDVETGESDIRDIPELLRFFAPQYGPGGDVVAVEGVESADQLQAIYTYDLGSEEVTKISGDGRAGSFTWHPRGRIYHLREVGLGTFELFRMRADGSDVEQLTEESNILGAAAVSWDEGVVWYIRLRPGMVDESELVRHDLRGDSVEVLGGEGIANPRLSIDDRFLIVTIDDGADLNVAALDAESGAQLSVLTRSDEADSSGAIAPVESGPILIVSGADE